MNIIKLKQFTITGIQISRESGNQLNFFAGNKCSKITDKG